MNHVHQNNSELDYDHIIDGIFIGTNQCCIMGLADVLKKEGITADISLEEDRIDAPFGVDIYLWIPVVDHTAPTGDQLSFGVESLEKLVAQGRKVYVHCKNGHGRAPTLVAAYLIQKGYEPKKAIEFIATKRKGVHTHKPQEESLQKYYENFKK